MSILLYYWAQFYLIVYTFKIHYSWEICRKKFINMTSYIDLVKVK